MNYHSNTLITESFKFYDQYFVQYEKSKPEPKSDIEFDNLRDLQLHEFKDVHIYEIDFYESANFIAGLDIFF